MKSKSEIVQWILERRRGSVRHRPPFTLPTGPIGILILLGIAQNQYPFFRVVISYFFVLLLFSMYLIFFWKFASRKNKGKTTREIVILVSVLEGFMIFGLALATYGAGVYELLGRLPLDETPIFISTIPLILSAICIAVFAEKIVIRLMKGESNQNSNKLLNIVGPAIIGTIGIVPIIGYWLANRINSEFPLISGLLPLSIGSLLWPFSILYSIETIWIIRRKDA